MDIGIMIQLAMLAFSLGAAGIMSWIAYRKGKDDAKYNQMELDLKHKDKVEEVRTAPKLSPTSLRDRLRAGKF